MGDIQVTLLIGFFMLISYIWAKIPYGMTAVFCCLALEITGVPVSYTHLTLPTNREV